MKLIEPLQFKAERAWGALDVAEIEGATVRLHWTDAPYRWHVNDGAEVFVVLAGEVDMHYRDGAGAEQCARLKSGDIFHAEVGEAHYAAPVAGGGGGGAGRGGGAGGPVGWGGRGGGRGGAAPPGGGRAGGAAAVSD